MNKRSRKSLSVAVLMAGMCISVPVLAEVAYISDTLRVGVRPEPDTRLVPISVVTTGTKLEILERRDGYVRIRTDNGASGWIKDIYVVKSPPAGIRLKALQEKHTALEKKTAELEARLEQLTAANLKLKEQLAGQQAEQAALQKRYEEQQQILLENTVQVDGESSWLWWLLGLVVAASLAFFAGVRWHVQIISRRLGGLRV